MLTQHDLSHCCRAVFMSFVSGGGYQVKGPYVMCVECKKEFRLNYNTGEVYE